MRESSLENPKCTKTHGDRGFAPASPLTGATPDPLGELTVLRDPLVVWWVEVYHHSQEPHPGSGFELTLPLQCLLRSDTTVLTLSEQRLSE